MTIEQVLDLVEELRHALDLVDEDVTVAAGGEQRAGERGRITRQAQALSPLLQVDQQIARAAQAFEERRCAGLARAENEPRFAPGGARPEGSFSAPLASLRERLSKAFARVGIR